MDSHVGRYAGSGLNDKERGAEWPYLPIALGFLTGMIDIMGALVLGGYIAEVVTSDMIGSASGLAPGNHDHLLRLQLIAIPCFFADIVAVYFLVRRFGSDSVTTIRTVLLTQFLLLAAVTLYSWTLPHAPVLNTTPAIIMGVAIMLVIASSNMSMHMLDDQSATTWALTANSVRATIAVLNIATKVGTEQDRKNDWQLFRAIWPVVTCFLIGVFIGTLSVHFWHYKAWFVPATVSLLTLLFMNFLRKKTPTQPTQTSTPDTEMRTHR